MHPDDLNFRHLLYFWAVAKEGSITRAAERLDLSVQAISTQLGQLERQLGHALFAPQGRGLTPTEAGRMALVYADQIFQLGEQLRNALDETATGPQRRLQVGITDAVPKLLAFHLLEATLAPAIGCRLICREGMLDTLVAELAMHRIDLVLADRPVAPSANLKVYSHPLGAWEVDLYGTTELWRRHRSRFPANLDGAPFLLPTAENPLRQGMEGWFERHGIRPCIVAELSDSALLKTFGRAGSGLFAAPAALAGDIETQYGAKSLGCLEGVTEYCYAISTQRRIQHPAVEAIKAASEATLKKMVRPAGP